MGGSARVNVNQLNLAEVVEVPPTKRSTGVVWVDSPRLLTQRLEPPQLPEESQT